MDSIPTGIGPIAQPKSLSPFADQRLLETLTLLYSTFGYLSGCTNQRQLFPATVNVLEELGHHASQ